MLQYAITFLIIALVAAVFGFGGIAATAVEAARLLFFVFIALSVIAAIVHAFQGKAPNA